MGIVSTSSSSFTTIMSRTQPAYVTEETYQSHRSRQDTDIRREFGRQAALIEKGNKQLQVDLTTTFNNKLSNVNGTLSGRVGELSHEVQELKNEVHQVKSGLLDFGVRLERMEKVRMNGTKSRLYDKIEMFGKIVPGVGYQMPLYAPKNAGEFWKLKRDPTANNIRRLIYLVEFYNIDDYQHWHRTQSEDSMTSDKDDSQSDDGQSSSDSASSDLSLEDAVQRYPTQAVQKVATVLGLVEENFEREKRQNDRDCHYDPPLKLQTKPSPFLNSCRTRNPIRLNSTKHDSSMMIPHQPSEHEPR